MTAPNDSPDTGFPGALRRSNPHHAALHLSALCQGAALLVEQVAFAPANPASEALQSLLEVIEESARDLARLLENQTTI